MIEITDTQVPELDSNVAALSPLSTPITASATQDSETSDNCLEEMDTTAILLVASPATSSSHCSFYQHYFT